MHTATLLSILSLGGLAAAHGFPNGCTIDGVKYAGSSGAAANVATSPIRAINNNPNDGAPIFDPTSSDMACGIKSASVKTTAPAKPGSNVAVTWQGPTGINWFHDTGPILWYMAQCEGDCASFTPSASTKWFKIGQDGEKTPGTPGTWAQKDLNTGAAATISLPNGLANGGYLLRNEIIALQNGQTKGGAEYYPACIQLEISGGASSMSPSPTTTFPGAYSETDAGVFGNFYNPGVVYQFPGPAIANIAGGPAGTGGGSSSSNSTAAAPSGAAKAPAAPSAAPAAPSAAAPSAAAPSAAAAAPSSQCKKKRFIKRRLSSIH